MNYKKAIYLPQLIQNKIQVWMLKKKIKSIGLNCSIQSGFDIVGEKYISIGNNFVGGERIRLYTWNSSNNTPGLKIEIGDNVCITEGCYISAANKIVIKSGVLLGPNTFITDNFHGKSSYEELKIPPLKREIYEKGSVIIERNVWIGRNVCIMPGVTIGEGSVIGSNSVVTHDIPPFCIAAGVPTKVIRLYEEREC